MTPVGPHEVARMLGISRQRLTQLLARGDFAEPWVTLAIGRVWSAESIEAWAAARGRAIAWRPTAS